jgi:hypothetical protein
MPVRRVLDCDHLIDGGDLLLDGLDPEYEFLNFAKKLGALPLR